MRKRDVYLVTKVNSKRLPVDNSLSDDEKCGFFSLDVKDLKDFIEIAAKFTGLSQTKYIRSLIEEDMKIKRKNPDYLEYEALCERIKEKVKRDEN